MALYRLGEAELQANGQVIGKGTNWQDQLALIRVGATIVFLSGSSPVLATVSAIKSPTELTVIENDNQTAAMGKYVILLHDSITVEGLAQDVAETLRYYQSQETEIADAVDYFRTFDWAKFEKIATQVKTDAAQSKQNAANAKASQDQSGKNAIAAAGSASNAKTSETNSATNATKAAAGATTATQQADRAKAIADSIDPTKLLAKDQNLADVPNKTTARDNLEIGVNNVFTVSQLRARNGLITTTPSNANNDNPAAPFVNQLLDSAGKVISQAEFRADRNGNISIINRGSSPQFASLSSNGDFTAPNFIASNGFEGTKVELGQRRPGQASYADFHFGAKYDYDARIICDGMNSDQNGGGNLRFYSGFTQINSKGSTEITGGRLNVNNTETNFSSKVWTSAPEGSITIRPATAGYAHYLLFNDLTKNTGYIGNPSNATKDMTFYNYEYYSCVILNDRIRLQGRDTEVGANLHVNGSSVYVKGVGGGATTNTHLWLQNSAGRNRGVIYSNDAQVLHLRSDNGATGATGQEITFYGNTGECRATTFTNTSDERAKFWIKPVVSALDKICSLNGVTYSMHTTIQNTVRKAGVIAQDVKKILPEAVTSGDHKGVLDKNCNEIENPMAVDYNALSALYVEAFKELKQKIEDLEGEIRKLKGE